MINFKINEWQDFKIKEIFEIIKGKRLIEEDREPGNVSYFSASQGNNGLTDMISNPLFIEKDSLIYTTFGDCYFVDGIFTASDEVSILKNKNLNTYNGLFVVTIITKNKYKYAYGRKAFKNKFENEIIKLPAKLNKKNKYEPDWEYMENYIKKSYNKIQQENDTRNMKETGSVLNVNNWKSYLVSELFEIYTGEDFILSEIEVGDIPVVSHSELNLGVNNFSIKILDRKLFDNKRFISLADRGMFKAYTHYENFYIGTRVKALGLKYENSNIYILLYITTILNNESWRFNYGRNSTDKLPELKISLPSRLSENNKYEPDWEYMENYVKSFPYGDIL